MTAEPTTPGTETSAEPPHRCRDGWRPPLPDGTAVPCLTCKPHLSRLRGSQTLSADQSHEHELPTGDDDAVRRDRDGSLVPTNAPSAGDWYRHQIREDLGNRKEPATTNPRTRLADATAALQAIRETVDQALAAIAGE